MKKKALDYAVFAAALLGMLLVNFGLFYVSAIYLILISAAIGIAAHFFSVKEKGGDEK